MSQLCEPSLTQTAKEEREEAARAKKTVHLIRILSEVTSSQFTSSDVFENIFSLLRHEDPEIGGWSLGVALHSLILSPSPSLPPSLSLFLSFPPSLPLSPPPSLVSDTLQILTHTGPNIDQSIAG